MEKLQASIQKHLNKSIAETDPARKQYYLSKVDRKQRKMMKLLTSVPAVPSVPRLEPTPVTTPLRIMTHTRSKDKLAKKCDICGKTGLDTGNLQQHIISRHILNVTPEALKSALVSTVCPTLQDRWRRTYFRSGPVLCSVPNCTAELKTGRSLRIHIVNLHQSLDADAFRDHLHATFTPQDHQRMSLAASLEASLVTTPVASAVQSTVQSVVQSRLQSVFESDDEESRPPTPSPVTPVRLSPASPIGPVSPIEPIGPVPVSGNMVMLQADILQEQTRITAFRYEVVQEVNRIKWCLQRDMRCATAEITACRDPVQQAVLTGKRGLLETMAMHKIADKQNKLHTEESNVRVRIEHFFEAYGQAVLER